MRRPPGRPSARAARATQTETRDRAQPGWRPTSDLKPQSQAQSVLGPGITAAAALQRPAEALNLKPLRSSG